MPHSSIERFALRPEQVTIPPGHAWNRVPLLGAVLGGVGLAASLALAQSDPRQFYFSWLVSFLFFLSLALGAAFFVLIHWAMQGGWGVVVRRVSENVMGTLLLFPLLFLPILYGIDRLYPWAVAGAAAKDHLLHVKEPFLNVRFFTLRAAFYFLAWIVVATIWRKGSLSFEAGAGAAVATRLRRFAGPAIAIFGITESFAAIDWIMSLAPHWYSTIFGVYFFAGSLVSGIALVTLLVIALERAGFLRDVLSPEHLHDLGKLLFTFTAFWGYIAFCQFFLIWYGNIPEETIWYKARIEGSWKALSAFLIVGHFALPFFYLMSRTVKRRASTLAAGAALLLVAHLADVYWLVMPSLHGPGMRVSLLDVTTLLCVGGLFLAALGLRMRGRALVPLKDPRLPESLSFENI